MHELLNQYLVEACQAYDLMSLKIKAVMESSARQLKINYQEAEMKVMTESGTIDDLRFLYEEADKVANSTTMKAITAIMEALDKFFTDCRDKMVTMLTSQSMKDTLEKSKKKLGIFPLLKRKKIMVVDYEKQTKCAAEANSKLTVLKAKLKSGQKVTSDMIDDIIDKFDKDHEKTVGVSAAASTTVGEAVSMIQDMSGKIAGHITETKNKANSNISDCKDIASKAKDAEQAHSAQALAKAFSYVAKTHMQDYLTWCRDTISSVKSAITSFTMPGSTNESTDMDMDKLAAAAADDSGKPEGEGPANNIKEEGPVEGAPSDPVDPIDDVGTPDPWDTLTDLDGGSSDVGFDDLYQKMFGDAPPEDALASIDTPAEIPAEAEPTTTEPEAECGEGCGSDCKEEGCGGKGCAEECGDVPVEKCGTEGCATENGPVPAANADENPNPKSEDEDYDEYRDRVAEESTNLDDLFNSIMNEATGIVPEQPVEVQESTNTAYENLLSEMENLFK